MRDDSPTADLVLRARKGDSDAWDALVERFAPLIWSICRRYSLGRTDADDVGQYVWLRLVEHLGAVHDPAALPGWLATTTQRECIRVLRAARHQHAPGHELHVEDAPGWASRSGASGPAAAAVWRSCGAIRRSPP